MKLFGNHTKSSNDKDKNLAGDVLELVETGKLVDDKNDSPEQFFECPGCKEQILLSEMKKNLYVCPKCGHFMGFQDYDILTQSDACPYCKTKYQK